MDPSVLYLEYDTVVYYNDKTTIKDASGISSEVNRAIQATLFLLQSINLEEPQGIRGLLEQ